ncbi:MAG TPA: ATP-binding cassette domain-containing protein [Quisquiliibacterium sp.]|nr:ATP-binding cassette domain-containing protein [Quisquiliibacterium sp.]
MTTAASKPVLQVEGLGVSYGALTALDDVSWSVGAGELLGIIGPNGAGKSSCYDAVTAMVTRRGRVLLDGEDVTDVPAHRLAERGLKRAFQQNAFFHELTVLDNMLAVMHDTAGTGLLASTLAPFAAARRRKASEAGAVATLERFGVGAEYHHRLPTAIPYGTQSMLSVALAHGARARALLLDEPGAGLGGADMDRLVQMLHALKREGLALVVIEHHMDLIMAVADRIVVLDQGRCIAIGSPREIQQNQAVLEAYLGRTA